MTEAHNWQERILGLIDGMHRNWAYIGALVNECKEQKHYLTLGCKSFEGWVKANRERIGRHRSTIFEARRMYKQLTEKGVSHDDMVSISRENAKVLLQLPMENYQPELVKEAKEMTGPAFDLVTFLQYPGQRPNDPKVHWGFNTVKSRSDLLDMHLEAAMSKIQTESPAEAVERALSHFVECEGTDD